MPESLTHRRAVSRRIADFITLQYVRLETWSGDFVQTVSDVGSAQDPEVEAAIHQTSRFPLNS